MAEFTHLDEQGRAKMVDVSAKPATERFACAGARVVMKGDTLTKIVSSGMPKGDVLAVARTAGIMAAKRTPDLIPLCHPIALASVEVEFDTESAPADRDSAKDVAVLTVRVRVALNGRTGAEMEALTAVSVAALTIYDMCKAVDRGMKITDIRLLEKGGGKSGHFVASEDTVS